MLSRFRDSGRADAGTVSLRFWSLLIVILILAVASSALAVRYTATPFLEAQQREDLAEKVRKDAQGLESALSQHRLLLQFLAGNSDFVDVVIGYVAHANIVRDTLENMQRPDALSWVRVYDAFEEQVGGLDVRAAEFELFEERELLDLASSMVMEGVETSQMVVLRTQGEYVHVVLAVPVTNKGFSEGAVVAGFRLEPAQIFAADEVTQPSFIVESANLETVLADLPPNSISASLKEPALAVVLVPDVEGIASAGRMLLTRTASAVALVLFGAFGIFAALGRAALVEPHRKLHDQKKSLSELAAVAKLSNDAIVVTDLDSKITWTNPAFSALSGYSAEEVKGLTPGALLQGPETDQATVREISRGLRDREPTKVELLNYHKSGEKYWVSISITPLEASDGQVYGFMAITYDITEARKQRDALIEAKNQIELQALHDPLTGLPNRRALDIELKERVGAGAEPEATLVRIDLDHFKYVNDTMGHEAGDFVLCEVAEILRSETKSDDLPVRVGGDEFVVLLGAGRNASEGLSVAERMLKRIKQPKEYANKTIRVGASFGVASTGSGLLPIEDLTVGADAALYEAKDTGRNRVRLYTPELHRSVLERRSLAREIRRGIANEEFVPYFQPQVDARTYDIVGVETLVRWESPELGLLYPDDFLPIAQQLSAVDDIDAILFRKALDQIIALRGTGMIIPKVSFNVTVERVQSPIIFETVQRYIDSGPTLAFEILESVLVEEQSDMFMFSLDRLKDMGVKIEIDDFGSGHASIVGLMHLMPNVMKIDKQLVMPITSSSMTRNLLKQIVGMADLMGLKITAEGVETFEHAEILAELGCHTLQGYAFAKAMPIDKLQEFVLDWQTRSQPQLRPAGRAAQ
ncbi:diguanylate cyclase/phosphodiesterase (GGDEF & EAL domains) with PAS/PAC sensor(s) [Candidatus Rhodobacter oscarellae]|uniref:Diguanylate cyclase/phosphodiesterase (GGDEF & EAL domains) with PAS/PAC sensor(S) n=1 Tax=Candidatus Rhodobacter oscarellae TaxID=1675527 RepID=A0A0J9GUB1_9RHOB|nr:EAL domain-containing protein [Candidatus Rhodobacter lobularis]KMW57153.1 diguanylate cyclase/phosphodiesterase (GGDEF & EAL domains) with PAS/PAC sensor(s) [Candidatus Rhodobacter lobularis]